LLIYFLDGLEAPTRTLFINDWPKTALFSRDFSWLAHEQTNAQPMVRHVGNFPSPVDNWAPAHFAAWPAICPPPRVGGVPMSVTAKRPRPR
jgi:hypothetical protein